MRSAWKFRQNDYGRPEIANARSGRPLHFNLSHTAGAVVTAISHIAEIGVDLENMERKVEAVPIAQSQFAPSEVEDLIALDDTARQRRFYEYWTLKEAYAKAQGLGLSLPTNQFWFSLNEGNDITLEMSSQSDTSGWQFRQFRFRSKYQGALAVYSHESARIVFRSVRL
jgi:4'-phosphopantetheinyl transferase